MEYTLVTSDLRSFDHVLDTVGEIAFGEDGLPSTEALQNLSELKKRGAFHSLLPFLTKALS
jgi:hypothetical protein